MTRFAVRAVTRVVHVVTKAAHPVVRAIGHAFRTVARALERGVRGVAHAVSKTAKAVARFTTKHVGSIMAGLAAAGTATGIGGLLSALGVYGARMMVSMAQRISKSSACPPTNTNCYGWSFVSEKVNQGIRAAVRGVWEHGTIGVEACLVLCGSLSFKNGVLQLSGSENIVNLDKKIAAVSGAVGSIRQSSIQA